MSNTHRTPPGKKGPAWYIVDPDLRKLLEDLPKEKQERILEKALSQEVEPGDPAFAFLVVSLLLVEMTREITEENRAYRRQSEVLAETVERESGALRAEFAAAKETVRAAANRIETKSADTIKASRQILRSLGEDSLDEEMTEAVNWNQIDPGKHFILCALSGVLFLAGIFVTAKAIDFIIDDSSAPREEVLYANLS